MGEKRADPEWSGGRKIDFQMLHPSALEPFERQLQKKTKDDIVRSPSESNGMFVIIQQSSSPSSAPLPFPAQSKQRPKGVSGFVRLYKLPRLQVFSIDLVFSRSMEKTASIFFGSGLEWGGQRAKAAHLGR